jgi:hypothetical protein
MHFESFGQLSNYRNWGATFSSLWVRDLSIRDRASNEQFIISIVFPEQPLDLAMPETHECRHCEGAGSRLGKNGKDSLYFLKAVGIRLFRLSGLGIDSCVTSGVLACFQQLQWLLWDCQTLGTTRKAQGPWVIGGFICVYGGEGGIRTVGTGVSPYNGLAIHKWVPNCLENFLLYSSFSGLQIGRFDPFCSEMIRPDRATITIS